MILKKVVVAGALETNSYFYVDEQDYCGVLIDPGAEQEKLAQVIRRNEWKISKILLTHGHFDHIGAVDYLSQTLGIPYFIHSDGEKYLNDPTYNLSIYFGKNIVLKNARYFQDGDKISLGFKEKARTNVSEQEQNQRNSCENEIYLKVLHTPGHTLDSCVFYDEKNKIAFVEDTVFKGGGVGRTDFPGGNSQQLWESVRKIHSLPNDVILYSGHSDETSVWAEKTAIAFNSFT